MCDDITTGENEAWLASTGNLSRRGFAMMSAAALAACAAALGARGDDFFQPRCPDHLPRESCAPLDARDRRAFRRGHDIEIGEARPLHAAIFRKQRMIDDIAD